MCHLEKVYYQDPKRSDSDSIVVDLHLTHDENYMDGTFDVTVSSTGTYFDNGQVILDFNATEFKFPWLTLTIPEKFQPWVMDVGSSESYSDPDPLWFLMSVMHCDVKYREHPGFVFPGSAWVDKTCTFCDNDNGIAVIKKRTRRKFTEQILSQSDNGISDFEWEKASWDAMDDEAFFANLDKTGKIDYGLLSYSPWF
ncbi:hypothetical protein BGZ97_007448 [Linnemannia gamsii]|uniref:Uncharacterized protein n=1 Tax=Linnemannia gamsii TaxID=64522 RepID=A0A9P6QN03_9FUNG|nr:hypothetical protein BGZ97_007448 [Linnemannia gamsii]